MAELLNNFSFTIEADPSCWAGLPSHFELRMTQPLPIYALEQLRQRFFFAVTTTHSQVKSARAIAQMAFETEIGTAIAKLVSLPAEVFTTKVCERRSYLVIDEDMQEFSFLYGPALDGVRSANFLPEAYVRLFEVHLGKRYAKYRMCAIAALLCISTAYLIPEQVSSIERVYADTLSTSDSAYSTPGFVRTAGDTVGTGDGFNVIPHHVIIDTVSASDYFDNGHPRLLGDTATTSDAAAVLFTQGWRMQTSPVTGTDFRFGQCHIMGISDTEIYIVGGGTGAGASGPQFWKWDGANWSTMASASVLNTPARLWMNADASQMYISAGNGLFYSTNHGVSFTTKPWPYSFHSSALYGFDDGLGNITLFAGYNQGGVAKSTDGGNTWTTLLGLSVLPSAGINVIWGSSPTDVYFGGGYTGGGLLWHYNGSTVTQVTNVTTLLDQVMAIWGNNASDIYVGGSKFASSNTMLHTVDGFASFPTIDTYPPSSGGTIRWLSGIAGGKVYAALTGGSVSFNIIAHDPVVDLADAWHDDGAVAGSAGDSMSVWVNPATGRAVAVSDSGYIETNKAVSP